MMFRDDVTNYMMALQDSICMALEACDGEGTFREDRWERPGGGGGRTRVLTNGSVIEKGGVNFSAVHGELNERAGAALGIAPGSFFATGVSIVQHPESPMVPIIHMNVRYFEAGDVYWFGGGIDLTPHYVVEDDARWFHGQLKSVCDRFHEEFYPAFKEEADHYFFVKHRAETRGIGGIFYDRKSENEQVDKQTWWRFTQAVGEAFAPVYCELINRHRDDLYTNTEKEWQYVRRGRYAEFNLAIDRGTRFGLETDGRTESILMSLPPLAKWHYDHQVMPGSREARTLELLKKGINWV